MREIKFRAWDETNGMKTGLYLDFQGHIGIWNHEETEIEFSDYPHIKLMQFTNLKDKNGREIYEGDVVENEGFAGVIVWDYSGFMLKVNKIIYAIWRDCEVIGNIYESPELLGITMPVVGMGL